MSSLIKSDPMDDVAHWAEQFAKHCVAAKKKAMGDPNILPHGLNEFVGVLLDNDISPEEIRTALSDALKSGLISGS